MPLTILTYPDPLLKRISQPGGEITDELRQLAADMAQAMYKADGIGLAAPQIGEAIRLVVVDVTGPDKREGLMTLINPRLTPIQGCGEAESEEGCLSVPNFRSKVKLYQVSCYHLIGISCRRSVMGGYFIYGNIAWKCNPCTGL